MTDQDDPALAAVRLEQALERIAALAARPAAPAAAPPQTETNGAAGAGSPETEALALRLDALIARLRSVLGPEGGA